MINNYTQLCSLKLELMEAKYGIKQNGSEFGRAADLSLIFHSLGEVRKESNLPMAEAPRGERK